MPNDKYTINELSSICKVSKQSLYNLISKNKEFIKEHSTKQGRSIKYDQEVLNYFLEYYGHNEDVDKSENNNDEDKEKYKARIIELTKENEKLKEQVAELKRNLEEKESERKELLNQNGALILTLQQEKSEKMILLEAPKHSFFKKLFGRKQ